jgi:hypothetical protein
MMLGDVMLALFKKKSEKKSRKEKTIAHYKRMIEWAKTQPAKNPIKYQAMYRAIGEDWFSTSCLYCKEHSKSSDKQAFPGIFVTSCGDCELSGEQKLSSYCCDRLWMKLNAASNRKEWVKAAKKVLKYIKKYG